MRFGLFYYFSGILEIQFKVVILPNCNFLLIHVKFNLPVFNFFFLCLCMLHVIFPNALLQRFVNLYVNEHYQIHDL